jgi:hypothetical protein
MYGVRCWPSAKPSHTLRVDHALSTHLCNNPTAFNFLRIIAAKGHVSMNFLKIVFPFGAALALQAPALGADVGLGVGFSHNGSTIYVPIRVTPGFRIEPYVLANKTHSTATQYYSNTSADAQYGSGFFAGRRIGENTELFVGSRLAYVSRNQNFSPAGAPESSRKSYGYLVAPTVGFEYFIQEDIALGAEAAILYIRRRGHETNSIGTEFSFKETTTATFTAVTLKYYFR